MPGTLTKQNLPAEEALFERLRHGRTLITGNRRLARVLQQRYHAWRAATGEHCWPTPRALAWEAWLDECWEAASLAGVEEAAPGIPGPRQLLRTWESVLRDSPAARGLLNIGSLAVELAETRKRVADWALNPNDPAWSVGPQDNSAAFRQWNRAFEKACAERGWLPPEDRTGALARAVERHAFEVTDSLELLGFDELNPAQQRLLDALATRGTEVSLLEPEPRDGSARLWAAPDTDAELRRMALWVRHWLERAPGERIAVVVPSLPAIRSSVERQLGAILNPGETDRGRSWNISAGEALSHHPMIRAAFDWLRLGGAVTDIQAVSKVLRSPWLGGGSEEAAQRAQLERRLRKRHTRELRVNDVRYQADRIGNGSNTDPDAEAPAWHCPQLVRMLDGVVRSLRQGPDTRPPSDWAEAIDATLRSAGWPAAHADPADRWQALQAWRECLAELASLDATDPKLHRESAIGQLQRICNERVYQPQSPHATVQVLGLYEANGMHFDHLWVLGLNGENWPPPARPNPFIPGRLQVEANMPQATPQRELEVARRVTRRLLESAPDCIFSYVAQADGELVLPSPMLAGLAQIDAADIPVWSEQDWITRIMRAPHPTTDPPDSPVPLATGHARGGSRMLQHQALCPFRAFAEHRLGAEALEAPSSGVSPARHGVLLHRALEGFWRQTHSQQDLLELDETALRERAEACVAQAIDAEAGLRFRDAVRAVEARRLVEHILDYLEIERQRAPFEVVALEQERLPVIAGETVRLVVDRIDRLPSGEQVILDYKSGKVFPGRWFSDRPEDPQLPLYAITTDPPPAAIAFAVIRDGQCEFRGISAREGLLPGLPPQRGAHKETLIEAGENLSATMDQWRHSLHALMADFLAGKATVDPKHGRRTCSDHHCQLQSLCRIDELDPAHAVLQEDAE